MKLLIDNREPPAIIKYLNAINESSKNKITIEICTLDLGDYVFYDEITETNLIIIERKSLQDLESSIKDGRYAEQSFRLNDCPTHNHNIIYLIEGTIINYRKKPFIATLYSSVFSLNYFKGFSVINSVNQIETGEIIYNFSQKLLRENFKPGFYSLQPTQQTQQTHQTQQTQQTQQTLDISCAPIIVEEKKAYIEAIKTTKKSYITTDNITEIMLMQIPGISSQTAKAITQNHSTMAIIIESLKNNPECLDGLKMTNGRKVNRTVIESLKKYLIDT